MRRGSRERIRAASFSGTGGSGNIGAMATSISPGNRPIAVLQLGKLGDTVLTTPLLNGLRGIFPNGEIIVIAARDNCAVLEGHRSVDRIIRIPRGYLLLPTLGHRLRAERIGVYIDVKDHRSMTSRMVAGLAHADHTIAHLSNLPHKPNAYPLPPATGSGHFVDNALAPLALIDPERSFRRNPSIDLPIESIRRVDPQLAPSEEGYVLVNISAGDPSRHWGLGKWEALVEALSQRVSVAVICAPSERDKADEICAMRRNARPIRTDTILDAAVAVQRARVVVTPDTSIVHIASAFDAPIVALFPLDSTNLQRFAPLSTRQVVLTPHDEDLLASIEIDVVAEAVFKMLEN